MRLIDADKLPFEEVWSWESGTFQPTTGEIVDGKAIREAPTVQAIPIEWFEWLLDTMGDGMYNLRAVIKDWERYKENWEKENGTI